MNNTALRISTAVSLRMRKCVRIIEIPTRRFRRRMNGIVPEFEHVKNPSPPPRRPAISLGVFSISVPSAAGRRLQRDPCARHKLHDWSNGRAAAAAQSPPPPPLPPKTCRASAGAGSIFRRTAAAGLIISFNHHHHHHLS